MPSCHNVLMILAMFSMGLNGFSLTSAMAADKANEKADNDGFVPLFNGHNLDGWVIKGKKAGWKILDGGIIHSDGGKGGEWIRTEKKYSDFILKLEWKVAPGGNSGVFIRSADQGAPWVTGHEIQISNEQPPRDTSHCTGSLYGSVAVKPRPDETPEKWRKFEIHAVGKKIKVLVDGIQVIDADADKVKALQSRPLVGYVGLQDSHTGPGKTIQYRKIRIKDLTLKK